MIRLPIWFVVAFIFKVIIGCLYGKFYTYQIPQADTWNYFYKGLNLNQTGWQEVFKLPAGRNLNFLSSHSYFNYFRYLIMDMLSGFFSLLTGGRYYCNVILFNFIIFLGLIRLYRFLTNFQPDYKTIFFFLIFFFPPFAFWTSGFHRDGLLIAFLGVFLYSMQQFLKSDKPKTILPVVLSIVMLLFMRNFWGFSAIIVGFFWWLVLKLKGKKPFGVFSLGLLVMILVFSLTTFASEDFNFVQSLVDKQHAFLGLKGDSELFISRLSLNPKAYIKVILQGYNHLLFRPYPNEIDGSILYLFTFIENLCVWVITGLSIFFSLNNRISGVKSQRDTVSKGVLSKPENNVLLFLVIIDYAVIGTTVPFLGAIVRYKAPFELLLILWLVQYIPVDFLRKLVPKWLRRAY